MGIALHNYHQTHSVFPPGVIVPRYDNSSGYFGPSTPASNADDGHRFVTRNPAWGLYLTTFLELDNIYIKQTFLAAGQNGLLNYNGNTTTNLLGTSPVVFKCPSEIETSSQDSGFGRGSYCGVSGNENLTWGQNRTFSPLNGMFYTNSKTGMNEVIDGTSNTLFVGEVSSRQWFAWGAGNNNYNGAVWAAIGQWKNDDFVFRNCYYLRTINRSTPDSTVHSTAALGGGAAGNNDGFGSYHRGGAQFLFVDGAVRFLSENIDSPASNDGTFQRLAAKSDGKVPGDF